MELPARGNVGKVAAAVVLVVLVALIVVLATRDPAQDRASDSPVVGRAAPPIQETTLDGEEFDLDRLRGSWVVVNFFATWCVPCQVEHPELLAFHEAHAEIGDASVVSVVFDDSAEAVGEFFDRNGGDWPVVDGVGNGIVLDWAVAQVPESFLVAPNGVVVAKLTGGVTEADLEQLLQDVQP